MSKRGGFLDSLQQQKLPSHHCTFGPILVFSLTFVLGIICVGIGIALTNAASEIQQEIVDYTNETEPIVKIPFNLTDYKGNVSIYYEVNNFHQLRLKMRYSYDYKHFADAEYSYICTGETEEQRKFRLELNATWLSFLSDKIDTFLPRWRELNKTAPVPCGQRANLFFNDTITVLDPFGKIVPFTSKGISTKHFPLFSSEQSKLFKNPDYFDPANPCNSFKNSYNNGSLYDKPPNWGKHICKMENAMENEDFIVWMTPAYASKFRKPWRRLDQAFKWDDHMNDSLSKANYSDGLPNGIYTIVIANNWHIIKDGNGDYMYNKAVIITTLNWAGGKTNYLGYAYLIVGNIILLVACGLAIIQAYYPTYLRDTRDEHIRWRKNE